MSPVCQAAADLPPVFELGRRRRHGSADQGRSSRHVERCSTADSSRAANHRPTPCRRETSRRIASECRVEHDIATERILGRRDLLRNEFPLVLIVSIEVLHGLFQHGSWRIVSGGMGLDPNGDQEGRRGRKGDEADDQPPTGKSWRLVQKWGRGVG